jgi:vancomycin resistance protein YoaR
MPDRRPGGRPDRRFGVRRAGYATEMRNRQGAVAGVLVAVLVVLGATGAWLARAQEGHVPPGVEIGGIDVGGLPHEEARPLLLEASRERYEEPIVLRLGNERMETTPERLGAEPAVDRAFREADEARGALGRLGARLGLADPVRIPLEHEIDRDALDEELDRVAGAVHQEPRSAAVEIRDGEVEVVRGQPGRELRRDELAARLEALPGEVEIPVDERPPAVPDEEAEEAAREAEALLGDPPAAEYGEFRLDLDRGLLLRALRFPEEDGTIAVRLAQDVLEGPITETFGPVEQPPRDAEFAVDGDEVRLVEGRVGRRLEVAGTVLRLEEAEPGEVVEAAVTIMPPDRTTAQAREMRIEELVSEFRTPYDCCPPRVTNIRLGAEILDGQIIPAGARFSLNDAMGERTRDRGFVPAGTIIRGQLVDTVGGGVSQIATTVFNAAFFAGLELVAHTPHQFYISRYPMGREATISWGGPDLVFRNDWEAAILIGAAADDSGITIRFYSAGLGRRVETQTSEPYDRTQPRTVTRENARLPPGTREVVQEAGQGGFAVDYTRRVWRGDELIRDERYHTVYEPQNRIVEVGPE